MPVVADLSVTSTGYRLLLLGHLLFVIVGFGSTFVYPFIGSQASRRKGEASLVLTEVANSTARVVTTPFIYAAGVFGVLLVALGPVGMDEMWVGIALGLLLVAVAFAGFVHVPNLDKLEHLLVELSAGPPPGAAPSNGPPPQVAEVEARGKAAARNGGILHLLFAVILVLMVWRPGA